MFAEKVNPRWLQLNLFFVSPTCHHNLLCWESLLMLWRQDNSPSAHTISTINVFPPPPSAPGGGGYHGRSGGRGNGKLYLATQKAHAAAARRKEARANLLAPPPPSTPSNRAARYKICSDEKSLSEAPPATKLPRKKGKSIVWNNGIKRR